MSEIVLILCCAVLGSGVGFLAGLLGIGGGLVIVPILSIILLQFGVLPSEQVVVVAIATSLASILFTSTSSAIAHHKMAMCRGISHLGLWLVLLRAR